MKSHKSYHDINDEGLLACLIFGDEKVTLKLLRVEEPRNKINSFTLHSPITFSLPLFGLTEKFMMKV